jgi:hypothetical protein
VDFLTELRNNFKELIVPNLDQKTKEAFLAQTSPDEMTFSELKRVKYSILNAMYGEYNTNA